MKLILNLVLKVKLMSEVMEHSPKVAVAFYPSGGRMNINNLDLNVDIDNINALDVERTHDRYDRIVFALMSVAPEVYHVIANVARVRKDDVALINKGNADISPLDDFNILSISNDDAFINFVNVA